MISSTATYQACSMARRRRLKTTEVRDFGEADLFLSGKSKAQVCFDTNHETKGATMSILRHFTKLIAIAAVIVACAGAKLAGVARGDDPPRVRKDSSFSSKNPPPVNEPFSHT